MHSSNKQVTITQLGYLPYQKAWAIQEALFNEIVTTKLENQNLDTPHQKLTPNYLLSCEHPHVYTLGKSDTTDHLLASEATSKRNYISRILRLLRSWYGSKVTRHTAQVQPAHIVRTTRIMQEYIDVKPIFYTYTNTPVGRMLLVAKEEKLIGTYLVAQKRLPTIEKHWECREQVACFESLKQQLIEYFKGRRTQFSVAHTLEGTPLQKETWEQLNNIPYGKRIAYKELAQLTSFPHAIRAVATAVGCNPLLILLPCHRVVRSNGKLGGFSAGTSVKQQLLALEKNRPA